MSNHAVERNVRLYPWYRSLTAAMAWLPIFFLFFSEYLTLKEVILLEAIYYISVVILEVPSGYFSDMIGRKSTLIISSILFLIAYILFGIFTSYTILILAQVFLAAAISFRSGTDTSFYFESLSYLGRSSEFPEREASVQSMIQFVSAIAVLAGGFIGAINLQFPYLLSGLFVLPALIISFLFVEPKLEHAKKLIPFFKQLQISLSYLKHHGLLWIFLYSILMYALTHIPYEFYQPYLKLLEDQGQLAFSDAAVASGILFAAARFVGSFAAKMSVRWTVKFGMINMLMAALLVQLIIIGLLGWKLHWIIVGVVLFRNFSMLLSTAPINAAIAPLVDGTQRATYFSIQSLVSRLSFAVTLFLLALPFQGDKKTEWSALQLILLSSLLVGLLLTILLLFAYFKNKISIQSITKQVDK